MTRSFLQLRRDFRSVWARLWQSRGGNVLMLMAFALIPLTFATGMVIDYSRASRLQTKLNAAADAASLAAVAKPMLERPIQAACNAARKTFLNSLQQNSSGLIFNSNSNPQISITETYSLLPSVTLSCDASILAIPLVFTKPLSRTVTINYTGDSNNAFAGVLGKPTLVIRGGSTARTALAPYIDIYMALDTSQSMGLAATDADAQTLWTATGKYNGRSCQFGCHARDPKEKYSMEEIARFPDVKAKLRVDVLREATMDMIDSAAQGEGTQKLYRFGLYRIGENFTKEANVIADVTDNLDTVKTNVSTLQLGPNDGSIGYGDTNLTAMLNNLKPMMGTRGDGTSPTTARAFLFIVTDGVQDLCGNRHCTSTINDTLCQQYKDAGITVGVVYTTYLPVRADPFSATDFSMRKEYKDFIAKIPPENIAPALRRCASAGWFFEASDGPTIHTAMQNLFRQATQTPAITR